VQTAIRTTERLAQANEWSLVLTAAALPYRLEGRAGQWRVLVDDDHAMAARAVLDAYDAEREAPPRTVGTAAPAGADFAWSIGLMAGLVLLALFAVTGPGRARSEWFQRGAGAARLMWHGEPWRAVTALTLHVDGVHVVGNSVATVLLVTAVAQRLGPGVGLALFVLAGAIANLLAAAVHGGAHVAVGISTATFGALGILAALQFARPGTVSGSRTRRWTIPVATLLLLLMLGTSPNADVLAHAAGLLTGALLGLVVARRAHPAGALTQLACGLGTVLVVAAAWALAFVRR
jgi:membrane associated rhomboid family serine protease